MAGDVDAGAAARGLHRGAGRGQRFDQAFARRGQINLRATPA